MTTIFRVSLQTSLTFRHASQYTALTTSQIAQVYTTKSRYSQTCQLTLTFKKQPKLLLITSKRQFHPSHSLRKSWWAKNISLWAIRHRMLASSKSCRHCGASTSLPCYRPNSLDSISTQLSDQGDPTRPLFIHNTIIIKACMLAYLKICRSIQTYMGRQTWLRHQTMLTMSLWCLQVPCTMHPFRSIETSSLLPKTDHSHKWSQAKTRRTRQIQPVISSHPLPSTCSILCTKWWATKATTVQESYTRPWTNCSLTLQTTMVATWATSNTISVELECTWIHTMRTLWCRSLRTVVMHPSWKHSTIQSQIATWTSPSSVRTPTHSKKVKPWTSSGKLATNRLISTPSWNRDLLMPYRLTSSTSLCSQTTCWTMTRCRIRVGSQSPLWARSSS